jgi:hypothetical protein
MSYEQQRNPSPQSGFTFLESKVVEKIETLWEIVGEGSRNLN